MMTSSAFNHLFCVSFHTPGGKKFNSKSCSGLSGRGRGWEGAESVGSGSAGGGGGLGEVCLLVAPGARPMSITARTSKSQGSSLV